MTSSGTIAIGFVRCRQAAATPSHSVELTLSQLIEIQDYLRHSYAIRLWEPATKRYSYYTLFEPGIQYPCKRTEPLILQVAVEGQREIRLDIGELAQIFQTEVSY